MGETQQLAQFVVETRYEDLPSDIGRHVRRSLLDWLGVALGASSHPLVDILIAQAAELGGAPQATVLGRGFRTNILWASLINGAMSHVLDIDDTHLDTILHPSAPVLPAMLALAEHRQVDGRSFVTAFALGFEVEARVALSVYPWHYDNGWHITGTAGTLGAAAAAGKLLGLDVDQMAQALGLAATQAAGLREMFGTMSKPLHPGKAAMNGLLGALLAGKGFSSSRQGLEAPRGFCPVLSSRPDLSRLTRDLGRSWEILRNSFKPYACGVVTHPVIDGVLNLRSRYGLQEEEVQAIEATVHPLVLELTGKTEPSTGLEGKFSVYHCAAVALLDGAARPAQFTDDRVQDPQVVALRRRVKATPQSELREDEAVIRVRLRDGRVLEEHVLHATGSRENPLSDDGLRAKFVALVGPVLGGEVTVQLVQAVDRLESATNLQPIIKLCARMAGGPSGRGE